MLVSWLGVGCVGNRLRRGAGRRGREGRVESLHLGFRGRFGLFNGRIDALWGVFFGWSRNGSPQVKEVAAVSVIIQAQSRQVVTLVVVVILAFISHSLRADRNGRRGERRLGARAEINVGVDVVRPVLRLCGVVFRSVDSRSSRWVGHCLDNIRKLVTQWPVVVGKWRDRCAGLHGALL